MTAMAWIRDQALTLALMAMFLLFLAGQLLTGFAEYNSLWIFDSRQMSPISIVCASRHLDCW